MTAAWSHRDGPSSSVTLICVRTKYDLTGLSLARSKICFWTRNRRHSPWFLPECFADGRDRWKSPSAKSPAHCALSEMHISSACCEAFVSRPGPMPARRHGPRPAQSTQATLYRGCRSLDARVTIVSASTYLSEAPSCAGSTSTDRRHPNYSDYCRPSRPLWVKSQSAAHNERETRAA